MRLYPRRYVKLVWGATGDERSYDGVTGGVKVGFGPGLWISSFRRPWRRVL